MVIGADLWPRWCCTALMLAPSRIEVLLSDLDTASSWDTVIAAEPQLELLVSEERFDMGVYRANEGPRLPAESQ